MATTSNPKKWIKSATSHGRSRLLSLPAELQVMVLNELLINDKPIGSRQEYLVPSHATGLRRTNRSTKNPYATPKKELQKVKGHHLYPEILATCQTLCQNGSSLLYNENILQIEIITGHGQPCYCGYHCHESAIAKVTTLCEVDNDPNRYLARAKHRRGAVNEVTTNDEARSFASKFRMFSLKCCADAPRSVTGVPAPAGIFGLLVKADLASLFLNRYLAVDLSSGAILRTSASETIEAAKAFQSLRCKSFKFINVAGDNGIYKAIENVIEGSTEVPDLRTANQNTQDIEDALVTMVRGPSRRSLFGKFSKLEDAMYVYDVQEFDKIRKELVKLFRTEARKLTSLLASDDETVADAVKQQNNQ